MKGKDEILQHNPSRCERHTEHAASPARPVPREGGIGILLIDDHAPDIARFRYALKETALPCQLKFLTARSEVEVCVRQAATATSLVVPRLILTECQLPSMELDEIIAAVRTVPAFDGIPIVLFSALDEAEGQRRCLQCGATAFVPKPRNWEALVSAVATMVPR